MRFLRFRIYLHFPFACLTDREHLFYLIFYLFINDLLSTLTMFLGYFNIFRNLPKMQLIIISNILRLDNFDFKYLLIDNLLSLLTFNFLTHEHLLINLLNFLTLQCLHFVQFSLDIFLHLVLDLLQLKLSFFLFEMSLFLSLSFKSSLFLPFLVFVIMFKDGVIVDDLLMFAHYIFYY